MNAVLRPETPKDAAGRLAAGAIRDGFKAEALHCYAAADGMPFYWRIRLKHPDGRKWIRPMHDAGNGFELGEPPAPPEGKPLYRLPELAAADPAATVWIVEGETCADALAKLGMIATTSGAADSAGAADWSPLRGRCCIVWPDHDKAGERYVQAVAERLHALGCTVETIDAAALGLPDKGDCVDWLADNPSAMAADVLALATITAPAPAANIVADALARLQDDPGAIFQDEVAAEIRRLEKDDMPEFVRIRDTVKSSGRIRMADFDSHCRARIGAQSDNIGGMFPEAERWHEPVDGAALLDDLCTTIQRFVIADAVTVRAAALWIVMSWLVDTITVAPIANITAPEKRCGKTVLLTLFGLLCFRALQAANISAPALFRAIEKWTPTLLIDEVDSFLR